MGLRSTCLVGFLLVCSGIAAFCLALLAEQHRSTASVVSDSGKNYWYCVYDSDMATRYGISASLLLLLSLTLCMVLICILGIPDSANPSAIISIFIIIGVSFITAKACLLAGTVINAHRTKDRTPFANGRPSCKTVPKGLFEAGSAFCLLHLFSLGVLLRGIAKVKS